MWAESEGLVEDVVVHFGDVTTVEGGKSVHHFVGDNSKAPPVYRTTVVLFFEYLGGEVLRGTTECSGSVTWSKMGEEGGIRERGMEENVKGRSEGVRQAENGGV